VGPPSPCARLLPESPYFEFFHSSPPFLLVSVVTLGNPRGIALNRLGRELLAKG
jgi:hypothetical protein